MSLVVDSLVGHVESLCPDPTRHPWRLAAAVALLVAGSTLGATAVRAATVSPPAIADVLVQRVARSCFVRQVHATGYILPRETAVVMAGAPDFRLGDVLVKPGDRVVRGDVVARARKSGDGASATPLLIRSLASGLVIASNAFTGMPIDTPAEPLFTIAVDGVMEAALDSPAVHAFDLAAGQVTHVSLRDGSVLDGRVRLAPLIIDAKTQVAQARVAFDATAHPIPGRFIRAVVEASRTCGLGMPQAAVLKTSERLQVQIVEDGLVATRRVTLGLAEASDVQVTSGLAEGDLVVANAGAAVHDGDRVNPIVADHAVKP